MNSLSWMDKAKSYIGLKEIYGPKHNPQILEFWDEIKLGGINNDEVPWCAAFVGAMFESVGIKSTRSGLAKSYLTWGVSLKTPVYGCVVVSTRKGGGHVGFVVGKDSKGNLYVLGGNQSDAVNVKLFSTKNVVGYRFPSNEYEKNNLEILSTTAEFETKVT